MASSIRPMGMDASIIASVYFDALCLLDVLERNSSRPM